MRITSTCTYYFHEYYCQMEGCERRYCSEHRLLYRECDTAHMTHDALGATWYETRECPGCMDQERIKKWNAKLSNAL